MIAQRLLDVIEHQLDTDGVGLSIAVVAGGALQWAGGFGRLDVDRAEPVTTRTVFPVQSVSKPIVATALMQWVERGAIGLDDPVNRHLHPVQVANEWEQQNPVTIRQLLTHTAGLPMSIGLASSASLEDLVVHEAHTEAEPGSRMIYANWGYDIVGYLVGRLSGAPWDEAVRDSVFQPLGMTSTRGARTSDRDMNVASPTGHVVSQLDGTFLRLDPPAWPFEPGPPSGSLVSDVEDLARFLVAHLSGAGAVLGAETIADMHRVHAPLGAGGGGMGLGFRVDRRDGRRFFCHVGDGSGFTTFIGGYSDEQVGVALLMNVGGAEHARAAITRAALDALVDDATPRRGRGEHTTRPALGGYRSTYWGLRADVTEADDGAPMLTVASRSMALAATVSRLTDVGGRWRADGGMFDGCELDFDTIAGDRWFCGGLYPFEFLADDTEPVELPTTVDETGDLTGRWTGTMETPVGPVPIDFVVTTGTVEVQLLDVVGTDATAETANGWVGARFELDIAGFGPLAMVAHLGLVEDRLQGLLSVRHPAGELSIEVVLDRG